MVSHRLPPLRASWWAYSATVRLKTDGTTSGLVRAQFPIPAGGQANLVLFETPLPWIYANPGLGGVSLQCLVDKWKSHEALLGEWQL